jgi:hypothetical protein
VAGPRVDQRAVGPGDIDRGELVQLPVYAHFQPVAAQTRAVT